jgi:hypothetical protein
VGRRRDAVDEQTDEQLEPGVLVGDGEVLRDVAQVREVGGGKSGEVVADRRAPSRLPWACRPSKPSASST